MTRLLRGDWSLACFPELLDHSRLPSKILLAADEDDGQAGTEVHYFRDPLHKTRRREKSN